MHISVLLKESIEFLNLKEGDIVVDSTVNRGGHSLEIAKIIREKGILICIDLDSEALKEAKAFLEENISKENLPKIFYINDNFRNLRKILEDLNIKKVDGVLADLGISSHELEISGRGFTFQKDEPLLMTLKDEIKEEDLTAEKIINNWSEESLADIIYYYGDEKYAKRIARNILSERLKKDIKSTFQLVEIISKSVPEAYKNKKIHFATKTFQALRIAVNDELRALEELINSLPFLLNSKKRASFITFHSGEDRVFKNTLKSLKEELVLFKFSNNKKFLEPTLEEIRQNPRSRSAKLRIIEKK